MSFDVTVVGGGVIGLAIAYHAAGAGARVAVVERAAPGAGASNAAAGMLAAQVEPDGDTPLYRLCIWSRDLYPGLAGDLRAETGIDIEWANGGIMELAHDEANAERLRATAGWQQASGQRAEWLDAAAAAAWVPGAPNLHGALLAPGDGHVHPVRLVQALAAAGAARGVTAYHGQTVTGLTQTATGQVTGVRTAHTDWHTGAVVLAGGAETGPLAEGLGLDLPVFPVKGQILALMPAAGVPGLWARRGTPVYGQGCYLVPRRNGEIVVGATAEPDAAFDRRVTAGGLAGLLTAAVTLAPALADATFMRAWTGLRPTTSDLVPILGAVPDRPGLFVATGHFRNGILLTPGTGRAMAALVAGQPTPVDLAPFGLERFNQ